LAILLRKLERKLWMDREITASLGGLQADALKNFSTQNNALSVFCVNKNKMPIERILAAIAGGRDNVQEIDYALFDSKILEEHGIKISPKKGITADDEVNGLHIDLIDLTANQVEAIASSIQKRGELKRIPKRKIGENLAVGLKEGYLNRNRINSNLFGKMSKYINNCS